MAATDRLMALRPDDPFYIELKGQILFETGNADQAVPLYRQAVRLAPGEPLLEAGLGRALLSLNRPEADAEALEVLRDGKMTLERAFPPRAQRGVLAAFDARRNEIDGPQFGLPSSSPARA